MKKLLLLLMAMTALTAAAATDYGIEVNGTKVTSDKLSFSTGGGTVTYNASSCTLTLSNVMFSRSGSAIKVSQSSNRSSILKIYFNGTCLLTSTGSDAVVLEEGAEFYVNSVTTITTSSGGKYAVHISNDEDASFYGSGSLLLEATDGYALGGQSGGDEWAYFMINGCTLAGKRGNLKNLGRVQVNAISTSVERSTVLTFNPTKSSSYAHAQGLGQLLLQDNVHMESPIGYSTDYLSRSAYYDETFVISDERNNPNYTVIGNFQYGTAYYGSYPVAVLIKPTVAYKQSLPTDVEVPGGVTIGGALRPVYVNERAFTSLTKVSRFIFKFGVMYLGPRLFDGCNVLFDVYLPSSIVKVDANAFAGAGYSGNTYMNVLWSTINPQNVTLTSTSFTGVNPSKIRFYFPTYDAIEKAKSTSYIASNNYVDPTPDLVTGEVVDSNNNFYVATTGVFNSSSVGELALVGTLSGQNSVLITTQARHTLLGKPYAITSVAPMAYYNNKNITTVRLDGSEITKIGDRAFYGCTNLTAAYLSNYTTTVEMAAFMDAGITTITIPETVKTLGSYAFSAATLTSVTWNATNANDISTSSAQPFEFCDNLQTFTVGANVTRMPTNLLTSNTSIKTVNWNARSAADFPDYYSSTFRGHSSITSFKFGNNVQHIPAYLCYILPNLALVSLPQSVKTIGRYAFAETGIMAVTIPSGVTSLGERAFGSCENLTTVYYNATSCDDMYPVDTDKAPFNGSLLTSFIIGNGVKRIPILLCRKQWALHSIVFPESLTEIGDLAFIECDSFESLTFPKNLESIGQSSFSGCTNVTNINAKMMNPASLTYGNDYIFAGVDKNACTLTVPNGTIPKYKAIMPWSEFFHIVQENGGILGDLDGNGILEVNDVVLLADIAMGGSGNGVDITVADMDGNGLIEVNDVVILAGMVMGS